MSLPRAVARILRRLETDRMLGVDFSPASAPDILRGLQAAAPPPPVEEALAALARRVASCQECRLGAERKNPVFGEGDPRADIVFVGEGPGAEEDRTGRPFVGKAGALLTKIIEAMGLTREAVYIANIVKCRPPGNRNPQPDEAAACRAYLDRQLELIEPRVVVALGASAAKQLLDTNRGITALRGRFFDQGPYRILPTFHPAYLLRNEAEKGKVWHDMKEVLAALGLPVPKAGKRGRRNG